MVRRRRLPVKHVADPAAVGSMAPLCAHGRAWGSLTMPMRRGARRAPCRSRAGPRDGPAARGEMTARGAPGRGAGRRLLRPLPGARTDHHSGKTARAAPRTRSSARPGRPPAAPSPRAPAPGVGPLLEIAEPGQVARIVGHSRYHLTLDTYAPRARTLLEKTAIDLEPIFQHLLEVVLEGAKVSDTVPEDAGSTS